MNWQYWFPERGETREDAREFLSDESVIRVVAEKIAEMQWRRDSTQHWSDILVHLGRKERDTVYVAGWCSHPSRDGDGKGNMVCGICGDSRPDERRR